jgi:hypothetical protein
MLVSFPGLSVAVCAPETRRRCGSLAQVRARNSSNCASRSHPGAELASQPANGPGSDLSALREFSLALESPPRHPAQAGDSTALGIAHKAFAFGGRGRTNPDRLGFAAAVTMGGAVSSGPWCSALAATSERGRAAFVILVRMHDVAYRCVSMRHKTSQPDQAGKFNLGKK